MQVEAAITLAKTGAVRAVWTIERVRFQLVEMTL